MHNWLAGNIREYVCTPYVGWHRWIVQNVMSCLVSKDWRTSRPRKQHSFIHAWLQNYSNMQKIDIPNCCTILPLVHCPYHGNYLALEWQEFHIWSFQVAMSPSLSWRVKGQQYHRSTKSNTLELQLDCRLAVLFSLAKLIKTGLHSQVIYHVLAS